MKTQGNQIAGSVIPWPCVFTPAGGGAHQGGDEDIEPQLIRVAFSAKTQCRTPCYHTPCIGLDSPSIPLARDTYTSSTMRNGLP